AARQAWRGECAAACRASKGVAQTGPPDMCKGRRGPGRPHANTKRGAGHALAMAIAVVAKGTRCFTTATRHRRHAAYQSGRADIVVATRRTNQAPGVSQCRRAYRERDATYHIGRAARRGVARPACALSLRARASALITR